MSTARHLTEGTLVAGRYRIALRIGAGRSAVVYKAFDLTTRSDVALKIFEPSLWQDRVAAERFRREVAALRQLDHPHIVKLYDMLDDPWPVLCMEYVDGEDAATHLARAGAMPLAAFLPVATAVAAALEGCHRQRVLHRDLKPRNVLLDRHGGAKLVDFGVARLAAASDLTETGALLGTAEYMAPELFRSSRADPRADIYALGAVCYELLAGHPPRVAASVAALLASHREPIAPLTHLRPDVPTWLDRIIRRCLAMEPVDRYQSAAAVRRDLARAAAAAAVDPPALQRCPSCSAMSPADLPFCASCGAWIAISWEGGRCKLVLERCGDAAALQAELERLAGSRPGALAGRLQRPPLVLAGGLSRTAAEALATQFAAVPCTLRVTHRPSARVEVPAAYAGLAALLLLPLLWQGAALPTAANFGIVAATVAILWACFRRRTRPLLRACELQRRAAPPRSRSVTALRQAVREVHDPALRNIVARIAGRLGRIAPRLAGALPSLPAEALDDAAQRAAEVARALEAYSVFLAASDPRALRERVAGLGWRIEREPAAAAELIAARAAAQRDQAAYAAIDDAYTRSHAALLDLLGVFGSIEDALERRDDLAAALRELDSVVPDLSAPPLPALRAMSLAGVGEGAG